MSFAARLAAAFIGVVLAVAVALAAIGFTATSSAATNQVDLFLLERAAELVDDVRDRPGRDGRGERADRGGVVEDDSVVQELNPDGDPLASSSIPLPIDDEDRELAASRSDDYRLQTVETDDGPYRMITAAVGDGGAVQVARQLTETNSTIDVIQGRLAVWFPLVAVLAGMVGLAVARQITKPLRSLTATVDRVAETGDLSVPVEVGGNDEVGRLAAGFDNLLGNLASSRLQQHQLVQDAAHELRTPLTSIKANIDLLNAAPDLDEQDRRDTLRSVQRELKELTTLVEEIVEVATDRSTPQAFGPVDLASVATEAVGLFSARSDRPVETHLTPTEVRGNHEALVRATGNLLVNADKYSPADEPVTVTVDRDMPRLIVADRGPGIDVDQRDRVFDRFYRSDGARSQPGSGLGLAIVLSIVDAHGGAVSVDDNPSGGAVVSFTLPAQQADG